jgi:hypothetical protein
MPTELESLLTTQEDSTEEDLENDGTFTRAMRHVSMQRKE